MVSRELETGEPGAAPRLLPCCWSESWHAGLVRLLGLVVVSLLLAWLAFVFVLAAVRPRGMDLAAAKAFVPDVIRLLRGLVRDPATMRGTRVRLGVLLVYLASPIDLVPDFIPVLGYADDVIVVSLVLRGVVRRAGAEALSRHWSGSDEGLAFVRRLAGLDRTSPRPPT